MTVTTPKKTNRSANEIIASNALRRSRGERILRQMLSTSYPHAVIGNVVNVIYGGDERTARSALLLENSQGLLDFIQELRISVNNGVVTYTGCKLSVDAATNLGMSRIRATPTDDAFTYTTTDPRAIKSLAEATALMELLVYYNHSIRVMGMIRKFELTAPHWTEAEQTLRLNTGRNALSALTVEKVVKPVTYQHVLDALVNAIKETDYTLVFNTEKINIEVNGTNTAYHYDIPSRD